MSPTRYRCAKSLRICSALNAHPELFPQAVIQKFTQCPRKIFIIRQSSHPEFFLLRISIHVVPDFCHPKFSVIQNLSSRILSSRILSSFSSAPWVSSAATVIRHICHPPGVIQKSGCYSAFYFSHFFATELDDKKWPVKECRMFHTNFIRIRVAPIYG